MPDTKITDLATGTTLHADDWLVYVDTHDTSMAATGTNKKVSPAIVAAGVAGAHTNTTSQVSDLSSWAGSTALTTLGTITTGTWTGTSIAIASGGTGQTTAAAAFNA